MNTEWTDPHVSTRTHKRQTEKVYQATHTQKSERARVSVGHTSSLTLTHTQRLEEGEREEQREEREGKQGGLNENIAVVVTSPLMVRLKAPSSNT